MPNAVSVINIFWNTIGVTVQHCECTKCQWVVHFIMVNGWFYLNYKEEQTRWDHSGRNGIPIVFSSFFFFSFTCPRLHFFLVQPNLGHTPSFLLYGGNVRKYPPLRLLVGGLQDFMDHQDYRKWGRCNFPKVITMLLGRGIHILGIHDIPKISLLKAKKKKKIC